jgi:DNA transposition AAA+ family ATPase
MSKQTTKQREIVVAAEAFMAEHGFSQKELAVRAGINPAYLNVMLRGETYLNETLISTKIWNKLGIACGAITDNLWPVLETRQHKKIVAELTLAKQRHAVKTIIADTRHGKTFAVEAFKKKNPKHTYVVTVNSLMTLDHVINALCKDLGLPQTKTHSAIKLSNIIMKLRDIRMNGGDPQIIIDEGENMKCGLMRMFKGLYDGVSRYASLVLIGTDQLEQKMLRYKQLNIEGGPQFYERFFPAMVRVDAILPKSDFLVFFDHFKISKSFQGLLLRVCNNYGALNHYLLPVLEECRDNDKELTEEEFRLYHNMAY